MLRRAIGVFEVDTGLLRLLSKVDSTSSCRWKDRTTDSEYENGEEKGVGLSTGREITVVLQFFRISRVVMIEIKAPSEWMPLSACSI